MNDPVQKSPSSRRGTLVFFVLWVGVFVTLLMTLPRWSLRVRCIEPVTAQVVTDDSSTLIAFSVRLRRSRFDATHYPTWPIRLIDLATGHERVLTRPEEAGEAAEIRDDFGVLFRAAGRQTLHTIDEENGIQQSGDHLALTYETIDEEIPEKRLQVVNWRNGNVELDAPFEGTYRFSGPRLLVDQHNGGSRLEIWTPGKKTIEHADWLVGYQDLNSTIVSPDGRWLIPRGSTSVWEIAQSAERFKVPEGVENAAFSPDSAQLVLVDRFERREPGHQIRRWRCLDTTSGAILREEQESLEWPDNRSTPRGPGSLRFLSDGQTVRYEQRGGATEWSPRGLQRREEDSEDDEGAGPNLPSVAKGWFVAIASDRKWAVSSVEPKSVAIDVYNRIASLLGAQDEWSSSSPFSYGLWNVPRQREVASVGRGSVERCWFTPDSRRLVTQAERELLIWDVPPGLPWGITLQWSLAVPLGASFVTVWRARRDRVRQQRGPVVAAAPG